MRLNKRGLTYISVLAVFLLLVVCSWNLFYFIKNYKLQLKYLEENRLIFYQCQHLVKEGLFFPEGSQELISEDISYQIETIREGQLVRVNVLASREGELIEEISGCRYEEAS